MKLYLTKTKSDDEIFIEIVERFINKSISFYKPNEVYVIKTDNWFDHKWVEFSGKVSGELGVWLRELRVPPFVPDRIVEELHFQKDDKEYKLQEARNLHIYQASEENALRKIKNFTDSAILVWFNGNTNICSQACLMFYQVENEVETAWYISFLKKETWKLYKTMNISRNEALGFIE
jgi:hypothetical protein